MPVIGADTREGTSEGKSMHGNYEDAGNSIPQEVESPPRKVAALMADENLHTPFKMRGGGTQRLTFPSTMFNQRGLLNGLPLGGFGPFPLTFHPGSSDTPGPPPELNGSLGKRKRSITGGINNDRIFIPTMAPFLDNSDATLIPSTIPIVDSSRSIPSSTIPDGTTGHGINLDDEQTSIWGSEPIPNMDDRNCANNPLSEEEITVQIGKDLRFEIEVEDPILREVLGESGEHDSSR